jgi:AmmeMemoRadiSam system protein B
MGSAEPRTVREASVAGAFYPATPEELAVAVDELLASVAPSPVENLVGLLAPHAGYIYSGPVAAHSYSLLRERQFNRVVVIAPAHFDLFRFASVFEGTAYATPLGEVPVDREFAAELAEMSSAIELSGLGHRHTDSRTEHGIEVQLPFLQRTLKQFRLVPVVMGDQDYGLCREVGVAIAELAAGTDTLLVASSDLSHYHPYQEAVSRDRKTLRAIEEYDPLNLARHLEARTCEACGGGPIVAAMIAAERLGAHRAQVLHYANSGDTSGDRGRVVGYGAVAFAKK